MIELVTFYNSFPPLRHSRRMTTASTFSSHNDVGSRASNTHDWVLKTTNFRCCRSILGYTLGVHVLMPPRERSPGTKLSRSLSLGTHQHFAIDFISSGGRVYSYVEKGCRKKCTRQSRKLLWVVFSSLFFKEIWKNGTKGHGLIFVSAKGKQQK